MHATKNAQERGAMPATPSKYSEQGASWGTWAMTLATAVSKALAIGSELSFTFSIFCGEVSGVYLRRLSA